ncbi:arginine--tRNA ligase [Neobacillus piezotolerans]|uniref:Arginine--tRNA ligase n=1 Tax=Neobacillus piezotolerans TaxID=2259171 RepID=A0A3D8GTN6_9BACI|nr:arginine--tRNA ligase [Neobacillus piezotolerans]RDU37823.1 arginine--tRNA ligase [Neobacillus piezotolerans]
MKNFKDSFADVLFEALDGHLDKQKISLMIEKPKFEHMGDLAFPCFELAKILRKSPQGIAADLAGKNGSPFFEKIEAAGGYVNAFLEKGIVTASVIRQVLTEKEAYGDANLGNGQAITIDLSSPNIAKPFSMGHLRSTVIGNALALISEKCGYRAIRINHLGDWGTQFGKLIVAYKLWGNEEKVKQQPIKELLKLYVQFHEEAEANPELEDMGRQWFKKLEDEDGGALSLWKWFREESLKEFSKIYDLLGIRFDSTNGEAFYNDKMDRVVELLKEKKLLIESDGAQVVQLEDLPPCLIKKKDGTTLYATRDLAAAIYRHETYGSVQSLYVVGNEQSLHFKQLFSVLEKMGFTCAGGLVHIPFGMMLKDGKKMSTRKGKVVLLEEVLHEAISLALEDILKKNPDLPAKEKVARQVGTGAVIFHDLKNFRMNDIEFSLEDMLRFEGETGPYVQYTHARAASLLRKGKFAGSSGDIQLEDPEAWPVVTALMAFPEAVKRAFAEYDPSQIAKYVIELSRAFNKYYASVRFLEESSQKQARLSLAYSVTIVLKEGLRLLGIEAPKEM